MASTPNKNIDDKEIMEMDCGFGNIMLNFGGALRGGIVGPMGGPLQLTGHLNGDMPQS